MGMRHEVNGQKPEVPVSPEEQKTVAAGRLITRMGGEVDPQTVPYKRFNLKKHERFLVQKGNLADRPVVFKVGETGERATIQNESRNLGLIEHAARHEDTDGVHFVRRAGGVFEDGGMVGLATEYLEDDKEAKLAMTASEKADLIGKVITELQKLVVSQEARQSGLPIIDGEKIVHEAGYFLQVLTQEGVIDRKTADKIKGLFDTQAEALKDEELKFVHGDAHGDNILVKQTPSGEKKVSLIDFEGLRLANRYYDWAEILNKADFLKYIQEELPDEYGPISGNVKNMWLDRPEAFDQEAIIESLTAGDLVKKENFRLTRIYDMLSRMMSEKGSGHPLARARINLFKKFLTQEPGA